MVKCGFSKSDFFFLVGEKRFCKLGFFLVGDSEKGGSIIQTLQIKRLIGSRVFSHDIPKQNPLPNALIFVITGTSKILGLSASPVSRISQYWLQSFQDRYTKLERFFIKINCSQMNYWILRIGTMVSCKKLDITLENKVI